MPLSTDGIGMGELSTSTWVTARRKSKVEPITFQTYDFGGQVVFYPTHQLFLTARSIYLVVFNVVEDDRTHVLYWLKQVFFKSSQPFLMQCLTAAILASPQGPCFDEGLRDTNHRRGHAH